MTATHPCSGPADHAVDAARGVALQHEEREWERAAMAGYREDNRQDCL